MNGVEIQNFSSAYGNKQVLRNININIEPNSITAIIGPSGCGKTTLLRSINRTAELEKGYKCTGDILVLGQPIYKMKNLSVVRRQVGMVYQTPVALPLSIKENVLFGPKYYGINKGSHMSLVEDCLRKAALWEEVKDRLNKPATQLSGGQKQRLAIARALAVKPQVLLLDEPCSSLDPASTSMIEELLVNLAEEFTIIIVTHNLFQARRIANKTIFILSGEIIEAGSTEALFTAPEKAETKGFISGLFG